MNREQKSAVIDQIAAQIQESQAVYAVDYRGITVTQAAQIRSQLGDADATLRIVKNSLTERAADKAGADSLKGLLEGPTALLFVRGDAAAAAKVIRDFGRQTELVPFKGGLLNGEALDVQQIGQIASLPSRDALYGQLVGMIASPITGLARGMNALLSGVAIALGQIHAKAEAGEIVLGGGAGATTDEPSPAQDATAAAEAEPEAEAAAEAETEEPSGDQPAAETQAPDGAESTTSDSQEDND